MVENSIITSFHYSDSVTKSKRDFVSLTDCLHVNKDILFIITSCIVGIFAPKTYRNTYHNVFILSTRRLWQGWSPAMFTFRPTALYKWMGELLHYTYRNSYWEIYICRAVYSQSEIHLGTNT